MEEKLNLNMWLDEGVDFVSRTIHIERGVDEVMSRKVVRALIAMSNLSSDPITIYLGSFGGDVYTCMSIYDAIRTSPCDITICTTGKVMSCGFIITLAANRRIAFPNTTFMMHSIEFSGEGNVKTQEIDVQEAKRMNELFLEILTTRTKRPKSWWRRSIISHNKYFTVQEALECGILTSTLKKELPIGKTNGKKRRKGQKAKT
jgi:ATP-dependent Clp protease, protease subunit